MFFVNIAEPGYTISFLLLSVFIVLLGKEVKKSIIPGILLIGYLILLVMHMVQYATLSNEYMYLANNIANCIAFDFAFVLLSYISYLWIDDIEAKYKNKKSIDNSLDWFWKKV